MKPLENPLHVGGIVNYFQGATIKNLVINGTMNNYGQKKTDDDVSANYTDEEIARQPEEVQAEELCHFVHPEIEDKEAWSIHYSIKRLVAHQKVPEICQYLKELKKKGKILLPQNPSVVYNELRRLGMPNSDGYSDKYFSAWFKK